MKGIIKIGVLFVVFAIFSSCVLDFGSGESIDWGKTLTNGGEKMVKELH